MITKVGAIILIVWAISIVSWLVFADHKDPDMVKAHQSCKRMCYSMRHPIYRWDRNFCACNLSIRLVEPK